MQTAAVDVARTAAIDRVGDPVPVRSTFPAKDPHVPGRAAHGHARPVDLTALQVDLRDREFIVHSISGKVFNGAETLSALGWL
ncbi:hypothetical protein ABZ650_33090 [Streptomyces griseoviridis]|uniref:hypothetical protein n=1 Tax=Streptomyces griseoviridis TaxID=45398 RepID=UPI0033CDC8C2